MSYQLLLLVAMIVLVVVTSSRFHSRGWPGRPGAAYQRVFSVGAMGLLFTIAGAMGWDLRYSHGWFQGTRLTGATIWWQLGLGLVLLLVAGFLASRVPPAHRNHA